MKRLWSFEPKWYEQQHLKMAELRQRDRNLTGNHPMDWLIAVVLVLTLVLLFAGVLG